MKKVLWVKFGWSDYYRGGPVNGNFSWLAGEENRGHEAFNFEATTDGTYYCYVPPHIGIHAPYNADPVGWTVVCLGKRPKHKGLHIVGWYEDATLLGEFGIVKREHPSRAVSNTDLDYNWRYCIASETAYFVPPESRTMPFSHSSVGQAKYSFLSGPRVNQTENKTEVLEKLKEYMKRLKSVAVKNPTATSAPDIGADPVELLRGFGTVEQRKMVEKAAEQAVIEHYTAEGFSHSDKTKENLGYDFIFTKGQCEHHVEIKGTSGEIGRFFMTRNENVYRKNPTWRFAIVTCALNDNRKVEIFDNREFGKAFELTPYVFIGMPLIQPGDD